MRALCEAYEHWLPLYAEGELRDLELSASIQRHLQWCEGCRDEVEDYRDFSRRLVGISGLGGASDGPAAEAPRVERIMGAIAKSARRRRARRLWWRRLGAIAAMLLFAGALGSALDRYFCRPPAPRSPLAFELDRSESDAAAAVMDPRVLEDVVWRFAGAEANVSPGLRGPLRLVGFPRRVAQGQDGRWQEQPAAGVGLSLSELRWILEARLRERHVERWGGGWPYLVPAAGSSAQSDEIPLPLCRVQLRRFDAELVAELGLSAPDSLEPSGRLYCLVVVGGQELFMSSDQELLRPTLLELLRVPGASGPAPAPCFPIQPPPPRLPLADERF